MHKQCSCSLRQALLNIHLHHPHKFHYYSLLFQSSFLYLTDPGRKCPGLAIKSVWCLWCIVLCALVIITISIIGCIVAAQWSCNGLVGNGKEEWSDRSVDHFHRHHIVISILITWSIPSVNLWMKPSSAISDIFFTNRENCLWPIQNSCGNYSLIEGQICVFPRCVKNIARV